MSQIVTVNRNGGLVEYEDVSVDSYFSPNGKVGFRAAVEGEKALSHGFLMDTLRKIMGRTLTVIDASVQDKQQNKAMKDLVRGIISDEMEFAAEMAFNQEVITEMAEERFKGMSDEEIENSAVSLEEALGVKE